MGIHVLNPGDWNEEEGHEAERQKKMMEAGMVLKTWPNR